MKVYINKENLTPILYTNQDNPDFRSDEIIICEIPEGIDQSCIKIEVLEGVITVLEDEEKTAAKAIADKETNKSERIAALNAQTWSTIIAEAKTVYGFRATDRNEASILILATHSTYESMCSTPAAYVGDIFTDEATVLAYAQPKLAASLAFGKWRLGVLASEAAQVAAIEAE